MAVTQLDVAQAKMAEKPDDEVSRLAYYGALADTELWVLLDKEPEDGQITPKLVPTGEGNFVMAFDSEERLADFARAPVPHLALPGRALIGFIAGQGVGLGVNVGVAPSETLLSSDTLAWLAPQLAQQPEELSPDRPVDFCPPSDLPEDLRNRLTARLAIGAGIARYAYLAGTVDATGQSGTLLAVVGALPGAETALAKAIAECVQFFSEQDREFKLAFLAENDPMIRHLEPVAHKIVFPEPKPVEHKMPQAPGSDPDKPPILH
ncbi:MAG: SseB family protein [Pseudomonadota bacterium]